MAYRLSCAQHNISMAKNWKTRWCLRYAQKDDVRPHPTAAVIPGEHFVPGKFFDFKRLLKDYPEIVKRIAEYTMVKDGPVHFVARLDTTEAYPPVNGSIDSVSRLPYRFHWGGLNVHINSAATPREVLAPAYACRDFLEIFGVAFYALNTFSFQTFGELDIFRRVTRLGFIQRMQKVQLWWKGARSRLPPHVNDVKDKARDKYDTRVLPLVVFSVMVRLRSLEIYLDESSKNARRRAGEPDWVQRPLMDKSQHQPNNRNHRDLRKLHGLDYIYQLRGLKKVQVYDYHSDNRKEKIIDTSFLADLQAQVMDDKNKYWGHRSQLQNLNPLVRRHKDDGVYVPSVQVAWITNSYFHAPQYPPPSGQFRPAGTMNDRCAAEALKFVRNDSVKQNNFNIFGDVMPRRNPNAPRLPRNEENHDDAPRADARREGDQDNGSPHDNNNDDDDDSDEEGMFVRSPGPRRPRPSGPSYGQSAAQTVEPSVAPASGSAGGSASIFAPGPVTEDARVASSSEQVGISANVGNDQGSAVVPPASSSGLPRSEPPHSTSAQVHQFRGRRLVGNNSREAPIDLDSDDEIEITSHVINRRVYDLTSDDDNGDTVMESIETDVVFCKTEKIEDNKEDTKQILQDLKSGEAKAGNIVNDNADQENERDSIDHLFGPGARDMHDNHDPDAASPTPEPDVFEDHMANMRAMHARNARSETPIPPVHSPTTGFNFDAVLAVEAQENATQAQAGNASPSLTVGSNTTEMLNRMHDMGFDNYDFGNDFMLPQNTGTPGDATPLPETAASTQVTTQLDPTSSLFSIDMDLTQDTWPTSTQQESNSTAEGPGDASTTKDSIQDKDEQASEDVPLNQDRSPSMTDQELRRSALNGSTGVVNGEAGSVNAQATSTNANGSNTPKRKSMSPGAMGMDGAASDNDSGRPSKRPRSG